MAELKFLRGSYTNWAGLTKDGDSFYIVEEQDGRFSLYLGDKFLCDGVSKADLANAVANLVNGASEGYDTLKGLETKVKALETAVGDGGSVAAKIQAAIAAEEARADAAEKANAQAIENEAETARQAEAALAGRVKAIEDAPYATTGYVEGIVEDLDATVGSQTVGEGKHVAVEVVEENGKLTAVTVTESDIASAQGLANEVSARTSADNAIKGRLDVIEGEAEGSIKKAVADAKAAIEGTLAALNDRIDSVVTDAKTYSIAKATTEELALLGTNVKEAYKLVDEDDVKVGEFIPVYKDSALQKVELVGQELQFTYLLTNGETSNVGVDVSAFLAESEFANGLQVIDHVVSVKRDATSEAFLTVGADGVKLAGVQDAINAAKTEIADRLAVIEGEDTVEGSVKKALKDAKAYTDEKVAAETSRAEGKEGELATAIATETTARENADKAINDTIGTVDEGKTVVEMIKAAEAAAIAAATIVAEDSEFVTIEQTGEVGKTQTYTIKTQDVASASATTAAMAAETATREAAEAKVLTDAKAYTDTEVQKEANRAQGIENGLESRLATVEGDYVKSVEAVEGSMIKVEETEQKVILSLEWGTF